MNHQKPNLPYIPQDSIAVPVPHGFLVATPAQDPMYPGIDVEFIPDANHVQEYDQDLSRPRVLIEKPQDDHQIRALIWNNPKNEDYTEEIQLMEYHNESYPDFKERCSDCPVLIETDETWYCDKLNQPCEDILTCPKQLENNSDINPKQLISYTKTVCEYCKSEIPTHNCDICPLKQFTKQTLNAVYGSNSFKKEI